MSKGPLAQPPEIVRSISILDSYCQTFPTDQNAVDIFKGEWSSQFPPHAGPLNAGGLAMFQDGRLSWAIEQLGGVLGQTVLELGPLEGAHTYMLEHAGAALVSAIEANSHAYLKCLITREILQLERTRFWYGNFVPYLQSTEEQFDLITASGVLYHMQEPIQLLELIARHTDRVYIWTHYFDAQIIGSNPNLNARFIGVEQRELGEKTVSLHQQFYKGALRQKAYCGGTEVSSRWLTRDGLVHALRHFGFEHMEFGFESPDHPNGPSLAVVATRS